MALYSPLPQQGSGAFGLVPGALDPISAVFANPSTLGAATQVGLPNPFGDLSAIYPNLGKTNNALSALIASQIQGDLSPQEQAAIQDARARYGAASGMVGSGLNRNATVRDLGLATGQRQQQGLANYGNIIPTISRTQTVDPALQAQINTRNANAADNIAQMNAQFQNQFSLANQANQQRTNEFNTQFVADRNATFAASPNPEQAQNYALQLFNDYLSKTQGAAGGGGQGFRSIQGPGGSGIGPSIGTQTANPTYTAPMPQVFSGTKASPASGSVIGGSNTGSVLGGGNGQGTFGNNWNANSGPSAVQKGTYTFGHSDGTTETFGTREPLQSWATRTGEPIGLGTVLNPDQFSPANKGINWTNILDPFSTGNPLVSSGNNNAFWDEGWGW